MHFFQDLGLKILAHWQRANLDQSAFAEIASAALRERPPSAHVEPMDVVRWVHETPSLVPQADIESKFGQPAITVFRCEGFYIDVLFWVDGTTAIHQHRFSGAFHVLQGSSLQSTYRFAPTRRYSEQLLSGDLELLDVTVLAAGDVRPIVAGAELIHALFHLDRPSVSVVVRTPFDACAGPQYSYSRAGLAFDPFARSEALTRKLETLDLLRTLARPEFETFARTAVERADAFQAFRIITHLAKRFEPHERLLVLLDSLRSRHEDLIDRVMRHVEEERRNDHVVVRRRLAKQPEHRFFLALLLNLENRSRILQVVRRSYPDHDPVETVLRWLGELEKVDAMHAWVHQVSTAGGATEAPRILDTVIDEFSLQVARHLLDGATDTLVSERLGATHEPGKVLSKCAELRGSLLFRPLFRVDR